MLLGTTDAMRMKLQRLVEQIVRTFSENTVFSNQIISEIIVLKNFTCSENFQVRKKVIIIPK